MTALAHVHDAAPSRDPTGTKTTRLAFATALQRRWRLLELAVRDVLIERDAFGIRTGALSQFHSDEGKLREFQAWFDHALQSVVVGDDRGQWFAPFILRGYARGLDRGRRMSQEDSPTDLNRYRFLVESAHVELQGVAEAVSQQAVRAFGEGLLQVKPLPAMYADVVGRIRKVGSTRSKMLASYAVVRAHASGTLDALEAAGVTEVSVQAEHIPAIRIGDRKLPQRKQYKLRTRVKRTIRSGRRREELERAERNLQQLKRVNVETAGDSKVCPICEEIAEEGPYHINVARGLIPAHPNCRCAFVAVSKKLQDHTPGGHEHDQKKHGHRHGVAIDPNQVFYHGTRHEFEEFSHEAQVGRPDGAFYFSPRYQPAENYSTVERGGIPRVIEAKLDVKNAKVMGWDEGSTLFKETADEIKAEGFDGVVMYKSSGEIYEVGVFDPHQVKIQKSTLTPAEAIAARGWNKFKDAFNPNQPRDPKGTPLVKDFNPYHRGPGERGGQFTHAPEMGSGSGGAVDQDRPKIVKKERGTDAVAEQVQRGIDAIPAEHAKLLKNVPISVVQSIQTTTRNPADKNSIGLFSWGRSLAVRGPGEVYVGREFKSNVMTSMGLMSFTTRSKDPAAITVHELGHALDYAKGWNLSQSRSAVVEAAYQNAKRMTVKEHEAATYYLGDPKEMFAEAYMLTHAPEGKGTSRYFGMKRERANKVFARTIEEVKNLKI